MKKIYTFTLDGEDYPSCGFRENLRIFAHMLYLQIYNYDGENSIPLNVNDNIRYNCLRENIGSYDNRYYFDSEIYNDDEILNYEPFIIGDKSFGFTINDELMDEETLKELVNYVLRLMKLDYRVHIDSECYVSKNKDDESHRNKAIETLFERLGCKFTRKFGFVRKLFSRTTGRYRRGYNFYGR